MSETVEVITDIFEDYHITATVRSHRVDFRVVNIIGWDCDDVSKPYLFGPLMNEATETPEAAPAFWTGFIKWDGCSNWDFKTEDCAAHFCGRESATGIGRLMGRLYGITAEHLATFDKDLGE